MNDWTKGYALTQPMDKVNQHIQALQSQNAELLEAARAFRAGMGCMKMGDNPSAAHVKRLNAARELLDRLEGE